MDDGVLQFTVSAKNSQRAALKSSSLIRDPCSRSLTEPIREVCGDNEAELQPGSSHDQKTGSYWQLVSKKCLRNGTFPRRKDSETRNDLRKFN